MRSVNDVVVKTVTTDSSGYVIKAVSTSTAGPGGCVVIHTEEEKRLVFFTEKSDHLVPELPPRIYHVPIFSRPSVITPACTEVGINTEAAQSSCKVCSQSKSAEGTLPQSNPQSNPVSSPSPPESSPSPPESSPSPPERNPSPPTDPTPQPTPSSNSHGTAKTRKKRKPRRRSKSKKRSSSRRKYCSDVTSSSDTESDFDSFSDTENSSSSCWCEKEEGCGIESFSLNFGKFNNS